MSRGVKRAKSRVWHIADVTGQISEEMHSKAEICVKKISQRVFRTDTCESERIKAEQRDKSQQKPQPTPSAALKLEQPSWVVSLWGKGAVLYTLISTSHRQGLPSERGHDLGCEASPQPRAKTKREIGSWEMLAANSNWGNKCLRPAGGVQAAHHIIHCTEYLLNNCWLPPPSPLICIS